MISYTELKKGMIIIWNNEPYEIVDVAFMRMQQRKATVTTKMKQLKTGKVVDRTWQASDHIEEAEYSRKEFTFLYANRGEYWFQEPGNPKDRFSISEELVGEAGKYLKANMPVNILTISDEPIKVTIPVKVDLMVTEAPPATKGNTAQGGDKLVTVEGGAKVTVPLFINEGDVIKVNTETNTYVERMSTAKAI